MKLLDLTRDIQELAEMAQDTDALESTLDKALDSLRDAIPYDLATIFIRDGSRLLVRSARGPLADERVRRHHLNLEEYPSVQKAMELRRPVALTEHDHAGKEGDPFDAILDLPHGHSCMVVPLFSKERSLGVMTFDRAVCEPFAPDVVALAGIYGRIVSLAFEFAEKTRLLEQLRRQLQEESRLLRSEHLGLGEARSPIEVTQSPLMRRVLDQARQVARTDTPVLILGETGTGKELLARAIHDWSKRADQPMIKLNCASIPEHLIESELFGHLEGAFTGATRDRLGRFQAANGGTLFLDEIGELPLSAQAKLLRVLQEGTFEQVGSDTTMKVDVRIVAATHVDLQRAAEEKRFREDLLYRLDIFPLRLPPLRERSEDIGPLSATILQQLGLARGREWSIADKARRALEAETWSGNVRQLRNTLERATILADGGVIDVQHLALAGTTGSPKPAPSHRKGSPQGFLSMDEMQTQHILDALNRTDGKIYGDDGAAKLLGMKPSTLQSRMQKLGVERKAQS